MLNIVQLLDAKLEDTSKWTEPQNCKLKHNKMLGILRKFVKAERTGNWMYICKPLEICCHVLQQLVITLIKIMEYLSVKDGKSETLMYISQRV